VKPRRPLREVYAKDRAAWRAWLAENHASPESISLVYYKQDCGKPSVRYAEAVEEALCFGWIDSRVDSVDAERYRQLFSPRKPRSGWSKINKQRIRKLIAAGLMTPAGLAKIEAAKRDGSWTQLDDIEKLAEPPALSRALKHKVARRHFDALTPSRRKLFIRWVAQAKREATQRARIEMLVGAARRGELAELFARLS
jgi:uncharacterized protein YdeI (YjbR/CyaY-like superfamily)